MGLGTRKNNELYTPEQVIAAAKAARGIVSKAARMLDCTRATVYRYVREYREVEQAFEDAREALIDEAEDQLRKKVESGDSASVFFTLKTIGKNRGYTERQEISGPDNEPVIFNISRGPEVPKKDEEAE